MRASSRGLRLLYSRAAGHRLAPGTGMVERGGFEPPKREARQIYSLLPLTTRPPLHGGHRSRGRRSCAGAREGTRTPNLLITNQLRCQLRHPGRVFRIQKRIPTQKRSAAADQALSMERVPPNGKNGSPFLAPLLSNCCSSVPSLRCDRRKGRPYIPANVSSSALPSVSTIRSMSSPLMVNGGPMSSASCACPDPEA